MKLDLMSLNLLFWTTSEAKKLLMLLMLLMLTQTQTSRTENGFKSTSYISWINIYNVIVQPDLKEDKTDKRFLKIFMTVCGLQLEVCGGIQAAPISIGVEQDGDAWNYPEPWGEPTQAVENQRKSKWKCKSRLRFTLLPWQDVFLLTLQNTASNLASSIKRTIKRLPRPPQMLPHLITAWKKQEETSVVADSQGRKRVALPSFPPEGVFIFDRRLCQLLQQLHLSCLHFPRFGSQKLPQREKRSSKREPWRWMENDKKNGVFFVLWASAANCTIIE